MATGADIMDTDMMVGKDDNDSFPGNSSDMTSGGTSTLTTVTAVAPGSFAPTPPATPPPCHKNWKVCHCSVE